MRAIAAFALVIGAMMLAFNTDKTHLTKVETPRYSDTRTVKPEPVKPMNLMPFTRRPKAEDIVASLRDHPNFNEHAHHFVKISDDGYTRVFQCSKCGTKRISVGGK